MKLTQEQLAEMIGKAVGDAIEARAATVQAGADSPVARIFAPQVATKGNLRRRDPSSHLGAYVAVMAKAKGIRQLAAMEADHLYGPDHPVTKQLMATGTSNSGEEMVQDTVANEIIEALRPASVVRALGPRMIQNPSGQMNIPRFDEGASMAWGGEAVATNATQQKTGNVTISWKKGSVKVPVTKELVLFSTPDIEAAVAADVVAAMATGTDAAYIRGAAGGDNPVGIINQLASTNKFAASAGASVGDIEADLRKLRQAVIGNNRSVNSETGAWLMSSRSFLFLHDLRVNGNLVFPELREATPRLLTYRVGVTNNIPDNLGTGGDETEILFGHMPSVLISDATGLEVEVLENVAYTNSNGDLVSGVDLDTVLVKATIRTDLALRHQIAWAALTGVTWDAPAAAGGGGD